MVLLRSIRVGTWGLCAVLVGALPAWGAGEMDASFGVGGVVSIAVTDDPSVDDPAPIAIYPDGGIVVATKEGGGDFVLFRFAADGTPDGTFGSHGTVTIDLGGDDQPMAVAVQADGKIVSMGTSSRAGLVRLALARLDPDGSIDTSFGSGGIVIDDFGDDTSARAMALQEDGKIVVVGWVGRFFSSSFAARYGTSGALDPTFGAGGVALSRFGLAGDAPSAVVVQPDGKIVACGLAYVGGDYGDWLLMRYLADGTFDPGFGVDGVVLTEMGLGSNPSTIAEALDLVIQPDGKIVGVGSTGATYLNWYSEFASARYDASGALDATYGTAGIVKTSPMPQGAWLIAYARAVARQPNGSLIVVGPGVSDLTVPLGSVLALRYLPDGSLDPSWDGDGIVEVPGFFHVGSSLQTDAALQPNGDVILATRHGGSVELRRLSSLDSCGNGIVEVGESCDDGNTLAGDCCSPACQLERAGSPCTNDGDACTLDVCDQLGTCTHPAAPDGSSCVDDDLCTTNEACTAGVCGGEAVPALGCRSSALRLLRIKDGAGSADRVTWVWRKGAAVSMSDRKSVV